MQDTHDPAWEEYLYRSGADESPAEWLARKLEGIADAAKIHQSIDALVTLGCTRVELLQELAQLDWAYSGVRADVRAQLERAERFHQDLLWEPVTELARDPRYNPDRSALLEGLVAEHIDRLRTALAELDRRPEQYRRGLLGRFCDYVSKETGGHQYQLVTPLIRALVDPTLTQAALRKRLSRSGRTSKSRASPAVPRMPKRRGRPTTHRPLGEPSKLPAKYAQAGLRLSKG